MSVATRARPTRTTERSRDRGTGGWRTVALVFLLALLVVVVVGAWYVSSSFQPLRLNAGGGPTFVRSEVGDVASVPAREPTSGHPFIAHEAPYHDGTWLEAGFTVLNDGPFPVTVDGVGWEDSSSTIRQVSVSLNDPATSAYEQPAPSLFVPFEPFTLQDGEARFVVIRYRFTGCAFDSVGEGLEKFVEPIRYGIEIAGITIHRDDALPLPFSLRVIGNDGCPGAA